KQRQQYVLTLTRCELLINISFVSKGGKGVWWRETLKPPGRGVFMRNLRCEWSLKFRGGLTNWKLGHCPKARGQ
ncbi:unnamed protein product, partial [Staurois parvus]